MHGERPARKRGRLKPQAFRTRLLLSFLAVLLLLGTFTAVFDLYVIRKHVVGSAQQQVIANMHAARQVYDTKLTEMEWAFSLAPSLSNMADLKSRLELDYLYSLTAAQADSHPSVIVREASHGNANGGTRVIADTELRRMDSQLRDRCRISVERTPRARPRLDTILDHALAIEYAKPFLDSAGKVTRVLYGGKVLNGRNITVDRIHSIVFENRLYKGKPVGTVTLFLDDVRIATNVLDAQGRRAIGTLVSEEVYRKVIERGETWVGRAFVVTDWYLTAYEPISDIRGTRVGILYVGILEKQFTDLTKRLGLILLGVLLAGMAVAFALAAVLSRYVSRPVTHLVRGTRSLSQGVLNHRVDAGVVVPEMEELTRSFNEMAQALEQRDASLRASNEKLAELNKTYLDLVGMVSHELKGVLASAVLNAYSVKDGLLGEVSPSQKKALESIARNLDYLTLTVKRFLDLSRIEKGELQVNPAPLRLREDVFEPSVEALAPQARDRHITIVNSLPANLAMTADPDLLQVVANNLLSNALKYGVENGRIEIRGAEGQDGFVEVEVYNDGTPIPQDQLGRLFKKFSRLQTTGRRTQGTGLGLFVTAEIVSRHGGTIRAVPREHGNSFVFTLKKDCTV